MIVTMLSSSFSLLHTFLAKRLHPLISYRKEKLILKIRDDIPTTPTELHGQSAGVSADEQIFYTENDDETEEPIWERKKEARTHPTNQLPDISFEQFTTHKIIITNVRQKLSNITSLAIEQNNDINLLQLRLKILKEDHSETIRLQDNRYQHYCRQFDRLSVTDEFITRQYYDKTCSVMYNQALLPKHLVVDLLEFLHGKANKHPGNSKMLIEVRQNYYYYPVIATIVKNGFKLAKSALKTKEFLIPTSLRNC